MKLELLKSETSTSAKIVYIPTKGTSRFNYTWADPASKFRGDDFSNIWQSGLITGSLL